MPPEGTARRLTSSRQGLLGLAWLCALGSAIGPCAAQELLGDPELESSRPDGSFPSSGHWQPAWLGQAGSICVSPGRTGNGLMLYTGSSPEDNWVAPFQERPASPGQAFRGQAWIRHPPGQPWVTGTRARVHVAFLNAATNVLTSLESAELTVTSSDWRRYEVVSQAAPPGTAFVRYHCVLEKPRGEAGLSVALFDDCSLRAAEAVGMEISSRVVGIPAHETVVSLTLRNTGTQPLSWRFAEDLPWLRVEAGEGQLAAGISHTAWFTVDRAGLTGTGCVQGLVDLVSEAGTLPVRVYVELPSPPVPHGPILARVSGPVLWVQERLPGGNLGPPYPYVVKGVAWSPSSRETPDVFTDRRAEFGRWQVADLQLLRAMNANTVYTFLDFGTDAAGRRVLDHLYHNGLKAIITVDENGTGNTNRLAEVVAAYRDHPAVLAWCIGNEWNINSYHDRFPRTYEGYLAAAAFTERLAVQVRSLDTHHPVVSTHGDIYPPEMSTLVNQLCPSVDIWGLNVYRGPSFTTLFDDWARFTTKPLLLSEYATDAYRTLLTKVDQDLVSVDGAADEISQARWNRGLWREIASHLSAFRSDGVCLGGSVFEWNDEWWKGQAAFGAQVGRHDNLGFYTSWNPDGHPDSVANEEWFGLVSVDRIPRLTWTWFQEDFAALPDPGLRLTVSPSPDRSQIQLRWLATPGTLYAVQGMDSLAQPDWIDLASGLTFDGAEATFADDAPLSASQRFYRVLARPRAAP